jgi:lysophospholipase
MAETVVSASRPAPADRELPPLALEFVEVAGMRVRLGHRLPQGRPYGTVVVLPGRAEFIEKYGETLGELTAEGFAVAILDWRGQGGSDRFIDQRYRGHVVQVDDYLADLTAVLERLQKLSLPRPYLILAHSMGGHIALRHLHDHPDSFAGAVLTAPMFGIQLRPTPEPVARALCRAAVALGAATRYAPGQRDFDLTRFVFATNKLTSCPERYAGFLRQLAATPELALGGVTFGWLGAALRSLAAVRRPGYLEAIETPILVCQAGIERIVSNRAQEETVRRLPHGRLLRFPEAKHELLLERPEIRQQVMRAFFDFAGEFTL